MANERYRDDEATPKERLSTADLADAGGAAPASANPVEMAPAEPTLESPVEVVHLSRPKEQNVNVPVVESATTAPAATRAIATGTGYNAAAATARAKEPDTGPLFSTEEAARLRTQWDAVQVGFVDEPRKAVEDADSLVATAMKRLAEQFAEERSKLESQWDRGGDVSTEDLRMALRRYRSFFGRLLAV